MLHLLRWAVRASAVAILIFVATATLPDEGLEARAASFDTCATGETTHCMTETAIFDDAKCVDTGSSFVCATCCDSQIQGAFCAAGGTGWEGYENCDGPG